MAWQAISLSVDERNWTPSETRNALRARVSTRVPLCASATSSSSIAEMCGWEEAHGFALLLVEYRQWPTARLPLSAESTPSSKTCVTRPRSLVTVTVSPSPTAMPADSWPRCCRACRPKQVRRATSSVWEYTPKTAHSSCGRSGASPGKIDVAMASSPFCTGRRERHRAGKPNGPGRPGRSRAPLRYCAATSASTSSATLSTDSVPPASDGSCAFAGAAASTTPP